MPSRFFYLFEVKGDINQIEKIDKSLIELEGNKFQLSMNKPK